MTKKNNFHNYNPLDIFELLFFIFKKKIYFLIFLILYLFISFLFISNIESRTIYTAFIKQLNFAAPQVQKEYEEIYIDYSKIFLTDLMLNPQNPNINFDFFSGHEKHLMAEDNLYRLYIKVLKSTLQNDKRFNSNKFKLQLEEVGSFYKLTGTFKNSFSEPAKIFDLLFDLTKDESYKNLFNIYNKFIDEMINNIDSYIIIADNTLELKSLGVDEYKCKIDFLERHFKLSDYKYMRYKILNPNEKKKIIDNFYKHKCLENLWTSDFFKIGKNFIKKELIESYFMLFDDSYYLDQINFYKSERLKLITDKKNIINKIKNSKIDFAHSYIDSQSVIEINIKLILLFLFFVFLSILIFYFSLIFSNAEIKKKK